MEKKRNLWVIPTDKPSRLFDNGIELYLGELKDRKGHPVTSYNIYITSDEEIGTDEYYFHLKNNEYYNSGRIDEIDKDMKFWKKIILTTDIELQKYGVQSIDDEFLEWFVNNPSCEEVEIKLVEQRSHLSLNDWVDKDENGKFPISIAGAFCYRKIYKIIIPKEEPKVSIKKKYIDDQDAYGYDILVKEKPKQETLEEAAVKWIRQPKLITEKESFIAGAKWQQERSYSEEDMKKMYKAGYQRGLRGLPIQDIIEVPSKGWFEQFKNK